MAEYIEREALRAKAVYMHGFGENKYVPLKAIENAPAADVEVVKRGRWERLPDNEEWAYCSQCHLTVGFTTSLLLERIASRR